MAGAGKSSTAKAIAEMLGYGFIDVDDLIKKAAGMPLQKIIDVEGDEGFIRREEKAIFSIQKPSRTVIATGGSAVYSDRAMEFLRNISIVIFLDVPYTVLRRRLASSADGWSSRGIVGLKNKTLHSLWKERRPLYARYADMILNAAGLKPKELAEKIILRLRNEKRLV